MALGLTREQTEALSALSNYLPTLHGFDLGNLFIQIDEKIDDALDVLSGEMPNPFTPSGGTWTILGDLQLSGTGKLKVDDSFGVDGDVLTIAGGIPTWAPGGSGATAPLSLIGSSDAIQLLIKSFSPQTTNPFEIQNSIGSSLVYVDPLGNLTIESGVRGLNVLGNTGSVLYNVEIGDVNVNAGASIIGLGNVPLWIRTNASNIDSATAVGVVLGPQVSFDTTGAKLLQVLNASTEQFYVDKDGSISLGDPASVLGTAGHTIKGRGNATLRFLAPERAPGAYIDLGSNITINPQGDSPFDVGFWGVLNSTQNWDGGSSKNALTILANNGHSPPAVIDWSGYTLRVTDVGGSTTGAGSTFLSFSLNGDERLNVGPLGDLSLGVPSGQGADIIFRTNGRGLVAPTGFRKININTGTNSPDMSITPRATDSSSAIGLVIDNEIPFVTTGAAIISVQNNGVPILTVEKWAAGFALTTKDIQGPASDIIEVFSQDGNSAYLTNWQGSGVEILDTPAFANVLSVRPDRYVFQINAAEVTRIDANGTHSARFSNFVDNAFLNLAADGTITFESTTTAGFDINSAGGLDINITGAGNGLSATLEDGQIVFESIAATFNTDTVGFSFSVNNADPTGLLASFSNGTAMGSVTINGDGGVGTNGDFYMFLAGGGIHIKEGANATAGVATLVAGTVTVATTKVTATSRIFVTVQALGGIAAPVGVAVTARTAGTSFTITSASALDTSTVAWWILEPA